MVHVAYMRYIYCDAQQSNLIDCWDHLGYLFDVSINWSRHIDLNDLEITVALDSNKVADFFDAEL